MTGAEESRRARAAFVTRAPDRRVGAPRDGDRWLGLETQGGAESCGTSGPRRLYISRK